MSDLPTAGRIEGRAHLLPVRVYYEDTDFSGLVYHANYLRFFERGRSDFLRLSGIGHAELLAGPDPTVLAARRLNVEFVRAARIDDALLVRTCLGPRVHARLPMEQEIHRGGELIASARVEVCCLWPDGRPKRPPAAILARLTPLLPEA